MREGVDKEKKKKDQLYQEQSDVQWARVQVHHEVHHNIVAYYHTAH